VDYRLSKPLEIVHAHDHVWMVVTWPDQGWLAHRQERFLQSKSWCELHAGSYRQDWYYGFEPHVFLFRDQQIAMLFHLTWC